MVRMNQSYKVGPSKSLRVYPGDRIDLEVRGYHENSSGYGNTTQTLATMISAVASAFGGVSGGGGESGSIFSGVNEAFGAYGLGGSTDSQPAAYLNYILFDTNYKMLTMGWTRVPATPLVKHTLTLNNLNIKEAGYIFVYLSYESLSNNFVYFDDMKITHTQTNVIQYNEYYPFGMSTANSWTRENTTGNNYLYNAGTELNNTSNVYDLFFRNYDPVLGRMNQVDPMATSFAGHSPYNYSFNDPVTFNDPMGDCPTCNTAKEFYENAQREMYGEAWRDRMRSLGRVGDDDLYGGMFGRMGAGVNWGAHEEFFQQKGIINTLQQIFKNATFSSGGRNGFWIKTTGINNATAGTKLEDGTPVLAELMIRNIFVSGISLNHFNTMLNPIVQRMHEGSREFAAHPFGGGLLAFVSGGGLFGAGGLVAKAAISARAISLATDLGAQLTIGTISNGGDFLAAIQRVSVTSLALSAANPTASFTNVLKNSTLSSAFELRFTGTQNILNGGKSLGDVAVSVGISAGSYGLFQGLTSLGNSGIGYASSRGDYLLSKGFSPGSSAYKDLVYIWAGSKIMSTTGFYGGIFLGN